MPPQDLPPFPTGWFAIAYSADLKPGEKIFVVAGKKQSDGAILAPSIVVGRNGVNPPM